MKPSSFWRDFQGCLLEDAEHLHRIVTGGAPQIDVDAAKQTDGVRLPAPAQITGNPLERGQFTGQQRHNG